MKDKISTIFLLVILFVGVSLLLYPTVSDYWNSVHQSQAISKYVEQVNDLNEDEYEKILGEAQAFNKKLHTFDDRWHMTPSELAEYNSVLNMNGTGIMGYIEIPEIKVSLPIYHGTEEKVLQIAIGHLTGSSLPIGGESTHAVVSGHRGLPSAKLFTDLDKLVEGDIFMIRVLNEVYTYEVDQIRIVLPQETSDLAIESGKDYCTLVTCTPYGVNTHRLLVRGHRIENTAMAESIKVTADAIQIEPLMVAPAVAAPILLILFIVMMFNTRKKKKR